MINEKYAKQFCYEDISLIENYEQAVADQTQTWHCHHRKEIDENKTRKQLIQEKLYYGRPANELIFLTVFEHRSLHFKGKPLSSEHRAKISETLKGTHPSAETLAKMSAAHKGKLKGKPLSAEHRAKISETLKGTHHSAETREKMSAARSLRNKSCHWWNNGIKNKFCNDCLGPEWKRGRMKKSQQNNLLTLF